jgi:micrococcal nuclease
MYQYKATVTDVHDGDTFKAIVDLGFFVQKKETFRMYGMNAPELKGDTKEAATKSRDELRDLILGKEVIIKSFRADTSLKQEKYGRFLVKVTVMVHGVPLDVNAYMVTNGFAVKYLAEE